MWVDVFEETRIEDDISGVLPNFTNWGQSSEHGLLAALKRLLDCGRRRDVFKPARVRRKTSLEGSAVQDPKIDMILAGEGEDFIQVRAVLRANQILASLADLAVITLLK